MNPPPDAGDVFGTTRFVPLPSKLCGGFDSGVSWKIANPPPDTCGVFGATCCVLSWNIVKPPAACVVFGAIWLMPPHSMLFAALDSCASSWNNLKLEAGFGVFDVTSVPVNIEKPKPPPDGAF